MSKPRLLKSLGIRAQTTIIAVVVVGFSVAAVMGALVFTARTSLTSQIANNAESRAQDIALLAKLASVPDPIPGRGEDLLVQVVDADKKVIASSASIQGETALVDVRLDPGTSRTFRVPQLVESDEAKGEGGADPGVPFLVAAIGVKSASGTVRTVIVAASLNPVQQLVDLLVPRLAVGLPLIMVIVGFTVWALTGRALHPVEAIRVEAEALSAASLDRRVPEPGTSDEIGRLATTVNRMLDRLESSVSAQQRFVSDASHELKSPIAAMRTMIDVARREHPDDLDSFLDDLAAEDMRLEHLVKDLLVLARFDEHATLKRVEEVDLDDVVLEQVAVVGRRPTVGVDISELHPARLMAQLGDMESLTRNLLDNATRHAASRVWIGIELQNRQAVLTVSDDGPGIAPEDRERVFERFVRLDESRGRRDGGTGLGLAVCRAIAQSMHGSIAVVEPLHGGTTLQVVLPLRQTV
jgi:signal transduction histidine kinase